MPPRAPFIGALILAALLLVIALGWAARSLQQAREKAPLSAGQAGTAAAHASDLVREPQELARLHAPEATVGEDVLTLTAWLEVWLSSTPVELRPPLATNADFVAVLKKPEAGASGWLPGNYSGLDADGQLLDRFGTPYLFHAESSSRITIRSAGPDRRLFTPDDYVSP
jgi:hypothetical protein